MSEQSICCTESIAAKGWWRAFRWAVLRRFSQVSMLLLFVAGPLWGIWIVKGNLAFSTTLDTLPLTDPHVLLQALLSGVTPELTAFVGAAIVLLFYALVGGRVYCSWVCPVNIITDAACCMRRFFGLRAKSSLSRNMRYWMLGLTLLLPLLTGSIVWELVNPVSMAFRGIVFGMGLAWALLLGIFLFELLIAEHGWCGRLCPVGAFYSLVGKKSLLRVVADKRERCDDCMDCFRVCPEPQVIKPALKGAGSGVGPVILSSECTNCGRCIDCCPEDVFRFGIRFDNQKTPTETEKALDSRG
jgi:ferredoxin-type protein NapH